MGLTRQGIGLMDGAGSMFQNIQSAVAALGGAAMNHPCNFCSAPIALADINVAADIALCRNCGRSMPFSTLAGIPGENEVDMSQPPIGLRLEEDAFRGRVITYHRKSMIVLFLIPFTLIWSGGSMGMIYGSQIASGEFDPGLSLFGLPFLFGTVVLVSIILNALFGSTKVWFDRGVCHVFVGVGKVGWTRRHPCSRDTRVSVTMSNVRVNNMPKTGIEIRTGDKKLMFGTMWREDAKTFVATALKRALSTTQHVV